MWGSPLSTNLKQILKEKREKPLPNLLSSSENLFLMQQKSIWWKKHCAERQHVSTWKQFFVFSSQGKATRWPVLALLMSLHSFWSNNTKGLFCFWRATKTYYIWNHLRCTKRQSSWVLDCSNNSHWDKASAAIASEKPPLWMLVFTICWEGLEWEGVRTGPCEHHICLTLKFLSRWDENYKCFAVINISSNIDFLH